MLRLKEPTRLQQGFFIFFRLAALAIIPLAPYIPSVSYKKTILLESYFIISWLFIK